MHFCFRSSPSPLPCLLWCSCSLQTFKKAPLEQRGAVAERRLRGLIFSEIFQSSNSQISPYHNLFHKQTGEQLLPVCLFLCQILFLVFFTKRKLLSCREHCHSESQPYCHSERSRGISSIVAAITAFGTCRPFCVRQGKRRCFSKAPLRLRGLPAWSLRVSSRACFPPSKQSIRGSCCRI